MQSNRSRKLGKLKPNAQARARLLIVPMFMAEKLIVGHLAAALLVVVVAMALPVLTMQAALLLVMALPPVPPWQM